MSFIVSRRWSPSSYPRAHVTYGLVVKSEWWRHFLLQSPPLWSPPSCSLSLYSLRFKIKVTFGHKLHYEINGPFGEISLKLRQTNWNTTRNNVSVVVHELPSQITVYTCLTIDIWTQRHQHTSTRLYALWCHPPKMAGFQ